MELWKDDNEDELNKAKIFLNQYSTKNDIYEDQKLVNSFN